MAKTKDLAFKKQLVEAVEKYPCLYNYNLSEYGKHKPTQLSWENIAKEVNDTLINCKETWKSIKIEYMLYITNKSVSAAEKKYNLAGKMQFIRPYLNLDTGIHKSKLGNVPSPTNDSNIAQEIIVLADSLTDTTVHGGDENNSSEMDARTTDDDDESRRLLSLQASLLMINLNITQKHSFYREVAGFIDDLKNNNVDSDVLESKIVKIEEIMYSP